MAGMSWSTVGTSWLVPTLAGGPTVTWYIVPGSSSCATCRLATPAAGEGVPNAKLGAGTPPAGCSPMLSPPSARIAWSWSGVAAAPRSPTTA